MIFWKEGARGARGTDQGRNQGTGIRATGTRNPLARETDGGGRETWRAAGAISQRAGMRPREMAEHLAPFCFLSAWLPRTATRTRGLCWAFAGRRGRGAIGCGDQGGVQFLPRFLWWWWWRRWSASCLKSRELGSCPCVPITKSSSPRPLALPNGRFQHTLALSHGMAGKPSTETRSLPSLARWRLHFWIGWVNQHPPPVRPLSGSLFSWERNPHAPHADIPTSAAHSCPGPPR